ncbi:hypothetical protein D2E70_04795 [Mycobacteroides abscessus]|nr:hypothetical protein D2E70_04795 [Mycobacteroides abscessus]SLG45894.1 Uncharacterised protein [Mycobacteroides abscessus subsp. massiliense]
MASVKLARAIGALMADGIPTRSGSATWHAAQVRRVLDGKAGVAVTERRRLRLTRRADAPDRTPARFTGRDLPSPTPAASRDDTRTHPPTSGNCPVP